MNRPYARLALSTALAVLFLAVCARFSVAVPGSPVPQSLQTLGVVLVGALMGARGAGVAMVAYLMAGALGLPVFADGEAGATHLVGPTAGYLAGFVAGAVLVGLWADAVKGQGALRQRARGETPSGGESAGAGVGRGVLGAFLAMCAAHAVILGLGWLRLAVSIGAGSALAGGVVPFLWGGVAKSAVGAAVWVALRAAWPSGGERSERDRPGPG